VQLLLIDALFYSGKAVVLALDFTIQKLNFLLEGASLFGLGLTVLNSGSDNSTAGDQANDK